MSYKDDLIDGVVKVVVFAGMSLVVFGIVGVGALCFCRAPFISLCSLCVLSGMVLLCDD